MLRRALDSDLLYDFRHRPVIIVAALIALVLVLGAVLAPWVAPHKPFDLSTLSLADAFMPPTRAATCCRRSCTARAFLCSSASVRS